MGIAVVVLLVGVYELEIVNLSRKKVNGARLDQKSKMTLKILSGSGMWSIFQIFLRRFIRVDLKSKSQEPRDKGTNNVYTKNRKLQITDTYFPIGTNVWKTWRKDIYQYICKIFIRLMIKNDHSSFRSMSAWYIWSIVSLEGEESHIYSTLFLFRLDSYEMISRNVCVIHIRY